MVLGITASKKQPRMVTLITYLSEIVCNPLTQQKTTQLFKQKRPKKMDQNMLHVSFMLSEHFERTNRHILYSHLLSALTAALNFFDWSKWDQKIHEKYLFPQVSCLATKIKDTENKWIFINWPNNMPLKQEINCKLRSTYMNFLTLFLKSP